MFLLGLCCGVLVFFLHCMLSCLLRLIMPFSMSSLSVCLGLGMKVRPFVRTLISVLVRLRDDRLTIA